MPGSPDGSLAPAHIPALDGLRGVAILLVIPHNADIFSNSAPWLWPMALAAHAGWIGVQLFFVLSGFLITRNLLAARGHAHYFRSFYARRALRIFPLYFLTLFVALVLLPYWVHYSPGALSSHHHQVWLWTFTSNWAQPFGADVSGFSHFWSLAVEEQFYLLWPFVVLLAASARLLWICGALVLIALLSRAFMQAEGAKPEMIYMFTFCRMDALAIGAAMAVVSLSAEAMQWVTGHSRALLLAAFGLFLAVALSSHSYAVFDPHTLVFGQTLLAVVFALLVVSVGAIPHGAFGQSLRRALEARWLRRVGRYSFAMYVFHLLLIDAFSRPIREALAFAGSATPLLHVITFVFLSFLAGMLSYHLLEKHFLALKRFVH
jgi:peptidoglycan/LPS O-acetylase OafA/YrhL